METLDKQERLLLKDIIKKKKPNSSELKVIIKEIKNANISGRGLAAKLLSGVASLKNAVTSGKKNPDWDYKVKSGENHAVVLGSDNLAYRDQFSGQLGW